MYRPPEWPLRNRMRPSCCAAWPLMLAATLAGSALRAQAPDEPARGAPAAKPAGVQIIILQPLVTVENIRDESELSPVKGGAADFGALLQGAARSAVESRGFVVVDPSTLQEGAAVEACRLLQPSSRKLARGSLDPELQRLLGRLSALEERYAVRPRGARGDDVQEHGQGHRPVDGRPRVARQHSEAA